MKSIDNNFIKYILTVTVLMLFLDMATITYAREGANRLHYSVDIDTPGTYILDDNISIDNETSSIIEVFTNDVTIDLNGFTLSNLTTNYHAGAVIEQLNTNNKRLTIINGFIKVNKIMALDIRSKNNVLRNVTITCDGRPINMGEGGLIENCIITGNNITTPILNKTNTITLGESCTIRNSILYGNRIENNGVLIKSGENGTITRTVIYDSRYGTDTNANISLIDGVSSIYDSVIAFNEGGDSLTGIKDATKVQRTIFVGNSAQGGITAMESKSVALCTAYNNTATEKVFNEAITASQANNSIFSKYTGQTGSTNYGLNSSASGCVSDNNTGTGYDGGHAQYCVAYKNSNDGYALSEQAVIKNCLAVSNGGYGIKDAVHISNNHCSTNTLPIRTIYNKSILLRNSVHGASIGTITNQYGKIIEPTPGDEITTDISTANFRW